MLINKAVGEDKHNDFRHSQCCRVEGYLAQTELIKRLPRGIPEGPDGHTCKNSAQGKESYRLRNLKTRGNKIPSRAWGKA